VSEPAIQKVVNVALIRELITDVDAISRAHYLFGMKLTQTVTMFDCPFAQTTIQGAVGAVLAAIDLGDRTYHSVGVNVDQLLKMKREPDFAATVRASDLITADGQLVVWWSRLMLTPLPERVASIDLMYALFEQAAQRPLRFFMLGAKPEVVASARATYQKDYPHLQIVGHHDGYFSVEEEPTIVEQINAAQTDILLIAISSPKKEEFVARNQDQLTLPFALGVGGSFDIAAGLATRAPKWMQRAGLEWLWRVANEPARIGKRALDDVTFLRYLPGEFWMRITGKRRQP
jgi:N-acetylglucosaminyldiphosphoundecaprenol N-acetyl-beta-D-mannosaminyltransferase